jgi:hypothetical protein
VSPPEPAFATPRAPDNGELSGAAGPGRGSLPVCDAGLFWGLHQMETGVAKWLLE